MSKSVSRALFSVPLGLLMLGIEGCNTETGAVRSTVSTCLSRQADSSVGVRLYLDDAVLGALQKRAAASDPAWVALKAHCDALTGATFNPPNGNAYPNPPDVGQGYQGDGYLPEVMNLGLCYRVIHGIDSQAEASYGAAGAQLLTVIATPASSGGQDPSTDDGYGIRNYGVAMATGYDWLGPALSTAQKQAIVTALDAWIDWYDTKGFSNAEPIGNYFAGYLLAKTTTAIATDPDNPSAAGYWSDVQTRMWQKLAQPAYSKSMQGGGWPEGWEYGPLAVREMAQFLWAVKTGKGLDWSAGVPFAHDEASYLRAFAWPSLHHMDDQGTIHSQTRLAPSVPVARALAGILGYIGDPAAGTARSYVADLVATGGDSGDPWEKFLFQDPSLASQPYTSDPLSYLAQGPGHVAVRSAWEKDAVWGTFVAGAYIDAPDSGEQLFNQGSVAVVAGDQPILVNATGWLPQAGANAGETFVYDDSWGAKTRLLYNTFFAAGVTQQPVGPGSAQTQVAKYEEQGTFAHARGERIADMYGTGGVGVSQFTRDFAYVRPGTFVVYDRTTLGGAADQWLAWHTPTQPTSVATSDATQARFDVASQGATVGSIRTLLPRSATAMTVNLVNGAAWRLEMHAPTQATAQDWLTVVTAGASVPDATRISSADGNVTSGAVVGVHVRSSPRNALVLFGDDHAAAATVSAATYAVTQTAPADHLIFDMAPSSTGYGVTAVPANGALTVTVSAGGPLHLTAQGTLAFTVDPDGTVAAMIPPPASPDAGSSFAPDGAASATAPASSGPTSSGAPSTSTGAISGSSSSSGGGC